MGTDIREYFDSGFQRLFGVALLAFDERNEQNNIPIAYREDNADEDLAFFSQFIERAVPFSTSALYVVSRISAG
jgi:hypothetical protein